MKENQINELFRLMGVSIQKIENVETRIESLETRVDGLETNFNGFKQETSQNLGEIKQEMRFMNRKVDVQMEDLRQTKYKVRDV